MNYRSLITKLATPFVDVLNAYLRTLPVTASSVEFERLKENDLIVRVTLKEIYIYIKKGKDAVYLGKTSPTGAFLEVTQIIKKLQAEGKVPQKFDAYSTSKENFKEAAHFTLINNVLNPR